MTDLAALIDDNNCAKTDAQQAAQDVSQDADRRIGAVVRSARLALGLSQVGVARDAGISKSYLSHIEAGRRPVPDAMLRPLLDLLGVGDPNHGKPVRIHVDLDGQSLDITVKAANLHDALAAAAALATTPSAWTVTS